MKVKTYKGNKNFELAEFKAVEENGLVKISGYANNKNIADRYGDIPTPYGRSFVYELEEYRRNPVLLLDHEAEVKKLCGKVTEIREDEKGLYFEAVLSNSDLPEVKHARTVIKEGMLKTVSIGGIWLYEDFENPDHLTLAKIFEISLVTIPADTYATFTEVKEPQKQAEPEQVKEVAPDYTALQKKMAVFEMKSKLEDLEVKTQKPAKSGKEQ
jgi:HK97 family phage prohead protease